MSHNVKFGASRKFILIKLADKKKRILGNDSRFPGLTRQSHRNSSVWKGHPLFSNGNKLF